MGNPFALDEHLCRRRGLRVRLRFGLDGSVTVDGRGRIIIAVTGAVRRRVNAAVAAVLVATVVLLVLGVALERHAESGAAPHSVSETVGEDEGHHEESGETTHEADVHGDEDNAGESATVDAIESPWVVALGTLAAAALAVAVWRRPTRPVIALVVAFTVAAMVFDLREIGHQASEGRTGLIVLAGVIVALRAATIAEADTCNGPERHRNDRRRDAIGNFWIIRGRPRFAHKVKAMSVTRSILLFILAAVAEIGGAWLIWQGVREHRGWIWMGAGVIALGAYGFIATLQPDANFGRILAAYGGSSSPDHCLGHGSRRIPPRPMRRHRRLICLLGVAVIMYAPRGV